MASLLAHFLLLRCRSRILNSHVAAYFSSSSCAATSASTTTSSSLFPFPPRATTASVSESNEGFPTGPCDAHDDPPPTDAADALRRWGGCSDSEASLILDRCPFLSRMRFPILRSKIQLLAGIGVLGPLLVKVSIHQPRLLAGQIAGPDGQDLHARLDFLRSLFPGSDEGRDQDKLLLRAVVGNPLLLNYDVERIMRPCVLLYDSIGVGRHDLGRLLLYRPTIIRRSSLDDDKRELIRRIGLPPSAATYKHAVSIVAVSRVETLHAKIANLEKFGLSNEEVMRLFARTPIILTFSIDKVQRNMTYLLATIKLPPHVVLTNPMLLCCNLDRVLRPRHLLGAKLQELGLEAPAKGPWAKLVKAVRMKEERFLEVFVRRHPEEVVAQLMEYYNSMKRLRRLAESSKSTKHKQFLF